MVETTRNKYNINKDKEQKLNSLNYIEKALTLGITILPDDKISKHT